MGLFSLVLIGIGLSIDSLIASITSGATAKNVKLRFLFKVALFMSIFQATMPFIGWFLGQGFKKYIIDIDHWIAFGILIAIGSKMLYEGFKKKASQTDRSLQINNWMLFGLATATSIDALIVGISLGLLSIPILVPLILIGGITFVFSLGGAWMGNQIGTRFNSGLEIFGGLILSGLGIKILVEHLVFPH